MKKRNGLIPAKEIAYIAVVCALLLGGQYVFSFVAGIEIVTLIFVCFSSVFGVKRGVLLALSFSILRCFIFGFVPSVLALYLIYYPALAVICGGLGHLNRDSFGGVGCAVAVNLLLVLVCAACVLSYTLDLVKVSRIYKVTVQIFLWVIFALGAALLIAFDGLLIAEKVFKKKNPECAEIIVYAVVAAVCTAGFTLLDDVISPLFYGMDGIAALAYFYASFTAMLPQIVCAIVTVTALYLPVTKLFSRFYKPKKGYPAKIRQS